MEEKEPFLFMQNKIGVILLERFCFAVKCNICKQLHEKASLRLFRGSLSVIVSEPVNRAGS